MPAKRSIPKLRHRAWELRQDLTPAEATLWTYLRTLRELGVHFRRQHAIGQYVTDFCAPGRHLVIEVDGGHHSERVEVDAARTRFLNTKGYKVIRLTNQEVMNDAKGVRQKIQQSLRRK